MAEVTPSGSGGPIQVSGPALDGGLEIRGGIGGITFQFEELMGGAEKLDDLASELAAVEAEVSRIQGCLRLSQAQAFGTDAEISLGEAQRSVQAVRSELQGISGQVRASKNDYELAELAAGVARGLGIPSVKDFLYSCTDQQITGLPNRNAMELVTGNVALSLSALLGLSPAHLAVALAADMAAGRHISAVGPLIRSLADGSRPMLKPRPLTVEQRESVPIQLDASLAGLLDRARIVDERGDGYVEVIEVDSAGQKAYVVVIPGNTGGR